MSELSPQRNKKSLKKKLAVGGGLALTLSLAACTNPTQGVNRTASGSIKPCAGNLSSPAASDGTEVSLPANSKLQNSANQQALVILDRVKNNGGNITLDSNLGTSASEKDDELILKSDDSNPAFIAGFEANIPIKSGAPVIGIGSVACNAVNGKVFQTNFYKTVGYFYSHTASFSANLNN